MVQEVGRDGDVVILDCPVQGRPAGCVKAMVPLSSGFSACRGVTRRSSQKETLDAPRSASLTCAPLSTRIRTASACPNATASTSAGFPS